MMGDPCPERHKLLGLHEGTLGEDEAAAIGKHLRGCERCERALDEIRSLIGVLKEASSARPPEPGECPHWELTAAYAEGTLSGSELERAECHLAECHQCLELLAGLWAPVEEERDTADVETRALVALDRESRTAVVAWREGAVRLMRGFSSGLREAAAILGGEAPEPAPAAARGSLPLRFGWTGPGGLTLECEVGGSGSRAMLLGRITRDGRPEATIAAALRGAGPPRGPESPDAGGRFGPWPLEYGDNALLLSGPGLPDGGLELAVRLVRSD